MLLSNKPTVILYNIFTPLSTEGEIFGEIIPNKIDLWLLCIFTREIAELP